MKENKCQRYKKYQKQCLAFKNTLCGWRFKHKVLISKFKAEFPFIVFFMQKIKEQCLT